MAARAPIRRAGPRGGGADRREPTARQLRLAPALVARASRVRRANAAVGGGAGRVRAAAAAQRVRARAVDRRAGCGRTAANFAAACEHW